jgi:hypothetical protein
VYIARIFHLELLVRPWGEKEKAHGKASESVKELSGKVPIYSLTYILKR